MVVAAEALTHQAGLVDVDIRDRPDVVTGNIIMHPHILPFGLVADLAVAVKGHPDPHPGHLRMLAIPLHLKRGGGIHFRIENLSYRINRDLKSQFLHGLLNDGPRIQHLHLVVDVVVLSHDTEPLKGLARDGRLGL